MSAALQELFEGLLLETESDLLELLWEYFDVGGRLYAVLGPEFLYVKLDTRTSLQAFAIFDEDNKVSLLTWRI